MSVFISTKEQQRECPLCMEPFELDDFKFFPCTCGYQICHFCWHRIRTEENGLCPACRKQYSESPANFSPFPKELIAQLKADRRQRNQQRKLKESKLRSGLAHMRVIQRNLVFVIGLPSHLADPETLEKHEYFGKFGKIQKIVISKHTNSSINAYITYLKNEDALRAIQNMKNVIIDGKLVKSCLGTTKYCSKFINNQTCLKPDCSFLHDFGDKDASFTKTQIESGEHRNYEKNLLKAVFRKEVTTQGTNSYDEIINFDLAEIKYRNMNQSSRNEEHLQDANLRKVTTVKEKLIAKKVAETIFDKKEDENLNRFYWDQIKGEHRKDKGDHLCEYAGRNNN